MHLGINLVHSVFQSHGGSFVFLWFVFSLTHAHAPLAPLSKEKKKKRGMTSMEAFYHD
jgi:hypothetical protein